MGHALTDTGRDWGPVDALIGECTAAGVVFRPKEGQLRPLLTAGRPPDGLLARVKASREAILIRLADLMDFGDLGEPPPLPDGGTARAETDGVDEWRARHAADSK